MDLSVVYEDTRAEARDTGTPLLKLRAWRARKALRADRYNPRLSVELTALEHELTARGIVGGEPRPDETFNRLA